jgi:hypothetical protein
MKEIKMAEEYKRKPGTGSLFKNDRKTEDWHADWRGKILLPDGTEHYIDMYSNKSQRDGTEYYGIRIGNPVANTNTGQGAVQNNQPAGEIMAEEDDLPF